jgi:preprotein translocase subunit YajC
VFISPAFAQAAGQAAAPGMNDVILQMAPFALILVIMYFLILRPQQKKAQDHAKMIGGVRRGDSVVTNGGIVGKVTKAGEGDQVEVEIAPNVRVQVLRAMIADVRSKGEPVKE